MVAMFRLVPTDMGVHTRPPEYVVASLKANACMCSARKTHHADKVRDQVPHQYRFKGPSAQHVCKWLHSKVGPPHHSPKPLQVHRKAGGHGQDDAEEEVAAAFRRQPLPAGR